MWNEQQRLFLAIGRKENALLKTLQKHGALNTRTLSFEADVPRVTAIRLLRRLWKRGFVSRHVLKLETRWSLVSATLLSKRLLREVESTAIHKEIALSDVASVSIYRGAEEMLASNKKILVAHAGERLLCIEPNAMWKHAAKIPAREWAHLNRLLKQKQIRAEIVLEVGFEKMLGEHVDRSWSESFFALSTDVSIVPAGTLSSPMELLIFRDQGLFLDWEQLVAVEIKSPNALKMLRGMFRALQQSGVSLSKKPGCMDNALII